MFNNTRGFLFAAITALTLSACGGGSVGDNDGEEPGGGPVPASISLTASADQILSNLDTAAEGITLTAVVKDRDNVVLSGQTVTFSVIDPVSPSADLSVTQPVTDSLGRAIASVNTGGNPTNRDIVVRARVGTLVPAQIILPVTGTNLVISGPDATQINTLTPYSALLTDASGAGLRSQTVTIRSPGNTILDKDDVAATTFTTNTAGLVNFKLRATRANSVIIADALGLTSTLDVKVSTDEFTITDPAPPAAGAAVEEVNLNTNRNIRVRWFRGGSAVPDGTVVNFGATRGTLSNVTTTTSGIATATVRSAQSGGSLLTANGSLEGVDVSTTRTIEFVATSPDKIALQASPANISATETSEITVVIRDSNDNLVKNVIVDFVLTDSSGGNISSPFATTNGQGVAKITYTANTTPTATRNVTIGATVRSRPAVNTQTTITVGGRAVDITIGTGAEILDNGDAGYSLPFQVLIADSSGNPVPEAQFTLSTVSTRFRKGFLVDADTVVITAVCPNEDVNLNDQEDGNEDTDNDGSLEPGRVASVPPGDEVVELDPITGTGDFVLNYPKDRGIWVEVMVIGTATVAGTNSSEARTLWLRVSEDDVENLPSDSPYGVEGDGNNIANDPDCADPN